MNSDINILDLRDQLFREHGGKWVNWLPEVLDIQIAKGDALLLNKLQAIQVCLSTDAPWREWHIFENIAKTFNHQIPNFGIMQPASAGEAICTMKDLRALRDDEFTEEVLIYVASCAFTDQLVYLPFEPEVQPYLDRLIYDDDLRDRTKAAWEKVKDQKKLIDYNYRSDDSLHQQLASLAILDQYIKEHDGSIKD